MAPRQRILEEGAAIRVRGCSCLYPLEEEETSNLTWLWTAIGFADGSEKLELWFRLPSWFPPVLMDFVRGAVPDRGMKPGLIVTEFNP